MPFAGFDPPESNFWRLPNNWFDLAAHFTSWAEHKVVEYILRHTWGYHEYDMVKLITMDEFMHGRKRRDGSRLDAGCGMAENSIKKGINDAVAHGFLIVRVDDADRGRIKKYYAPRMRAAHTDRPLIGDIEGQTLTLQDHFPTLEDQTFTPQAQMVTPDTQSLTLSTLLPDPPTEQKPQVKHVQQDTSGNNNRGNVVVLTDAGPQRRDRRQSENRVHPTPPVPFRADLVGRLVAEGIAPVRARSLVASAPSERIERQLGWIDRRSCRDRTATLVRAIEEDFSEPFQRAARKSNSGADQSKYFQGSYALCPGCGSRPCVDNCGNQ
jgi:hypothetical protein